MQRELLDFGVAQPSESMHPDAQVPGVGPDIPSSQALSTSSTDGEAFATSTPAPHSSNEVEQQETLAMPIDFGCGAFSPVYSATRSRVLENREYAEEQINDCFEL